MITYSPAYQFVCVSFRATSNNHFTCQRFLKLQMCPNVRGATKKICEHTLVSGCCSSAARNIVLSLRVYWACLRKQRRRLDFDLNCVFAAPEKYGVTSNTVKREMSQQFVFVHKTFRFTRYRN